MALTEAEKLDWLSTDNHRIVLMDLQYHDGASLQTARYASYPYIQPIGDVWNTFSNLLYDDIILNVPNIITRIDTDSTIGAIELLNTDGEYDWLLETVTLIGHPIQLSIGESAWIRDNFILILDGIVSAVSSNSPETIQISIRDRKENLNVQAQDQFYTTNGTNEYWDLLMDAAAASGSFTANLIGSGAPYNRSLAVLPESVVDTHVPVCLGKCFNIEPELIDSWNHIYHIHDSAQGIVSVTQVRSNGVPLIPPGSSERIMFISSTGGGRGFGIGNGGVFLVGDVITDDTNPLIWGTITGITGTNEEGNVTLYYTINDPLNDFSNTTGTFTGLPSGAQATATNPIGQQYELDLTLGMIRLLDHDQGTQITCDVVGQNGPSPLRLGGAPALVPYSAADIIEWLMLEKAGIPNTDICYETFPPSGSNPFPNTDELGLYYKDEAIILDLATKTINSVGGFLRFKSDICKLQLYLLKDPLGLTPDLTLIPDDIVENGISIASIEEPKLSITLGYKKNWKTQDEGSLAGSLTDTTSPYYDMEVLNSYMHEYSTIVKEPSPPLDTTEYPLAEHIELIETTIWDKVDADAELARRVGLRDQRRRIIRIQSLATSFTYDIGDIVHITHPRFGLELGKEAIIIGVEESPTSKRVTLEVWL
jgi:hypothetical protein